MGEQDRIYPGFGSLSGPLTGLSYLIDFVFETFIGVLLGLWFYVYVVYAYGLCLVWTQGSLTTGTSLGCSIGNPVGFHWRYCKCWLTRKAKQQSRALLYIILETEEGWRRQRPSPTGHVGSDEQSPKVLESLVAQKVLTQAEVGEYPPTAA